MLKFTMLAAPLLALSVLPVAAEGSRASFQVSATIVPMEPEETLEAEGTMVIESAGAPLLAPAPRPKQDDGDASLAFSASTE